MYNVFNKNQETGRDPSDAEGADAQLTLRQKDRFWTKFVERVNPPKKQSKENLSGKKTKAHQFFEALFILKGELMEKLTPLAKWHETHGGKMVSFAGFFMPIQYENGIIHEHSVVREKAGLFDVSHMGELYLKGEDSIRNLNTFITNDFSDLEIGKVRYGVLVYENGCAVDDVLVYRIADFEYIIVVNASNSDKDYAYLKERIFGDVSLENLSEEIGQIALQGPLSEKVLEKLTDQIPGEYYTFIQNVDIKGIKTHISRTGYTGEDGFEFYCDTNDTVKLWELLLETGQEEGVEPCGLGARDTLRLEAAMPLYGHELSESITPLEAGLKRFVKLDKENFIAQDALEKDIKHRRIGLELIDRGIAREGYKIFHNDIEVGTITSGTHSPTLGKAIALAYIDASVFKESEFEIEVRNRKLKAQKVKLPFYKK